VEFAWSCLTACSVLLTLLPPLHIALQHKRVNKGQNS